MLGCGGDPDRPLNAVTRWVHDWRARVLGVTPPGPCSELCLGLAHALRTPYKLILPASAPLQELQSVVLIQMPGRSSHATPEHIPRPGSNSTHQRSCATKRLRLTGHELK